MPVFFVVSVVLFFDMQGTFELNQLCILLSSLQILFL